MEMNYSRFGSMPVDSWTRVIILISTQIYNRRLHYLVSLDIGTDSYFVPKFLSVHSHLPPSTPIPPPLRPSTLTTYQLLALPGSQTPAQARCRSPDFLLGLTCYRVAPSIAATVDIHNLAVQVREVVEGALGLSFESAPAPKNPGTGAGRWGVGRTRFISFDALRGCAGRARRCHPGQLSSPQHYPTSRFRNS